MSKVLGSWTVVLALALSPGTTWCQAAGPAHGDSRPGAQVGGGARIFQDVRVLDTYPFSEPNPVPILVRDPRLYPYHSFEGYSADSEPRAWTVVTLENDYIRVFVLPEVGGKVWGAIVKETGHEFIYRNEVMKFRNIALRGPWTSGGIEFNFGIIGHTPSTATPVGYALMENPDGSVSCWVGAMDLPSRTHWRVEIRLPADRAYFETNVLWHNPTPLEQPYYSWMTAAAFARDDLEMSMQGNAYLQHSGEAEAWPVDDQGRFLPLYANNTFDGHKSYHVVGELHDFFGGYYHDEGFGFGHWAPYEDMPGQKLWLWALSREGGVWEELLTDTDGQYVEFQAGRLFVQYSPGSHQNPITQAGFHPVSEDRWSETWFPLEGLGGLTQASREGVLFARMEDGTLTIGLNAFREIQDTLKIWSENQLVAARPVALEPLRPFHTQVALGADQPYRVEVPGLELEYSSDPSGRRLARPFRTDPSAWEAVPEADRQVFQARELLKARRYSEARELFDAALEREPWNREALLGRTELDYRRGLYAQGLVRVEKVLQLDAYDPRGNFLAGILYQALERTADARDALGWAARSVAYRSAANVRLAEIMLREKGYGEAERYARLALDTDRNGIQARRILATLGRLTDRRDLAETALETLLATDPLDPFPRAETFLSFPGPSARQALVEVLAGEFPEQSLLELAVDYARWGRRADAEALLGLAAGQSGPGVSPSIPGTPVLLAWTAWLKEDPSLLLPGSTHPDEPLDLAFAHPYRPETLPVLEWAVANSPRWEWKYLLALNLWAVDRPEEGASGLEALGGEPDFGPLYVARAQLLETQRGVDPEEDLRRAVELSPRSRILHTFLVRHYQEVGEWQASLDALEAPRRLFPESFDLDLLQVRALVNLGRGEEAAQILETTHVLPSENARASHELYEQAHLLSALDALAARDAANARSHLLSALEWPESLGQGRPYHPEERPARFLLGVTYLELGQPEEANDAFLAVLQATGDPGVVGPGGFRSQPESPFALLAIPSLEALGRTQELEELGWGAPAPPASWTPTAIRDRFPHLFQGLEGRILMRSLELYEEAVR